jgi:tRNA threonylcarbamoyladenosine modification (KEOPS) complex  Pcc1 subunit
VLARRTVTVAGGKSADVSLQMSRNGRVSLARRRTLMTEVTITARDAAGNQATTRTPIRLLAPRRR